MKKSLQIFVVAATVILCGPVVFADETIPQITFDREITGFNRPAGVAVHQNGNLYIVDGENDQVKVYDPAYNLIQTLVGSGSEAGKLNEPYDVAFSSAGDAFITDTNNARVQVFDSEGNFKYAFSAANSYQGISIDNQDNVYVGGHIVEIFNVTGTKIGSIENYFSPRHVTVDASGRIYLSNYGNTSEAPGNIRTYDDKNSLVFDVRGSATVIPLAYQPLFIEADGQSRVWVADHTNAKIHIYDTGGTLLTSLQLPFSHIAHGPGNTFDAWNPVGIAVSANKLYVSNMSDNLVRVYTISNNDVTPPSIHLSGEATTTVALGTAFVDPGATATDNVDSLVTPVATGTVDTTATGTYRIIYTAADAAHNTATTTRTVIVFGASLDIVTVDTGTTTSGTLTDASMLGTTNSSGNVTVELPANLSISAPQGWDGSVDISAVTTTVVPVADSGNTASAVSSVEIGFGNMLLSFDKGVRILLAGQGSNLVGYSHGAGTFTPITNICTADTQTVGNALATGGDCKITLGSDLVVWTKHFSTFTTYTQSAIPAPVSSGSNSGGNNGGSGSGGNNGSSNTSIAAAAPVAPIVPALVRSSTSTVPTQISVPAGQVLGVSTFTFTKTLQRGSSGTDVMELQKILIAAGHLKIDAPTKYFGVATEAALKAYQTANGLESVGILGPKTRALLNNGTNQVSNSGQNLSDEARAAMISDLKAQLESLLAKVAKAQGIAK